jgi:hypothetical protein
VSLSFPLAYPTHPFYTGVGVSEDVPQRLPISLGGHAYMTDTPRIRRETLDVRRPAIDTGASPGATSLATTGVWSISASDWRHGAGQEFYDSRDSNPRMFRESKGCDPWTREELNLQPDTHQVLAAASTPLRLVSIANELWAAGNGVLKRSTTALDTTPSWTSVTVNAPLTGASLVEACTDGANVYTAHGVNGVGRAAKGAASISQWSTYAATKVWYANGRIFAYKANELVELASGGTASAALWSGGIAGTGVMVSVIGTPNGVLAAHNTDDQGEILFIGLDATDGSLAVPLHAGELNKGETFNELVYYGTFVLAATSRGLRLGQIADEGRRVSFGPALPLGTIAGVAGWGQFAWFIWNAYDVASDGLGRADLSTFTEDFVPAYASDLMVDGSLGTITDLVTHQGQPFFAIDGVGVYTQHPSELVAEATMHSGFVRFGTFDKKVVVGMDLRHHPLDGEVEIGICDESDVTRTVGSSATADSLGPEDEIGGASILGEALEVCLTMTPDVATTAGPRLHRWTMRAMNIGHRTDVIEIPLWVRTSIETGDGHVVRYDPLEEFRFLKSLEAAQRVVTLIMGDLSEPVIIDKVALEPERWTEGNHWLEAAINVRLLTI